MVISNMDTFLAWSESRPLQHRSRLIAIVEDKVRQEDANNKNPVALAKYSGNCQL